LKALLSSSAGVMARFAPLAIALLLVIVVFVPVWSGTTGARVLQDFGHGPIFGCVALLALSSVRATRYGSRLALLQQFALAFAITVVLGMATEAAQIPVGRDASWLDVRSDALGAAGFLALFAAWTQRTWHFSRRLLITSVGIAALIVHSLPLLEAVRAYARRSENFPVLAQFDRNSDLYFVTPQWAAMQQTRLDPRWALRPDETALCVDFLEGPYPGVDFYEPAPDWRGYREFVLDLINPTPQVLILGFRINDAQHNFAFDDRFNRRLEVSALSRQQFRIPLTDIESAPTGRAMDLAHIADFLMFRSEASTAPRMCLVRAWLE
jgi:hypothetical protein